MRFKMRRKPEAAERPVVPNEDDLIAYARAHVTSAGAHALLDEVERGLVRRRSEDEPGNDAGQD